MRTAFRIAAATLAVGLLVGCGADDTTSAPTPSETKTDGGGKTGQPSPSESFPPGPIPYTAIALVSASNAEGEVSPEAVVLDSRKAPAA